MTHLKAINRKANRVVEHVADEKKDVVALQRVPQLAPHFPLGCSLVFLSLIHI